jgi:hypothetical protein
MKQMNTPTFLSALFGLLALGMALGFLLAYGIYGLS